jgi:hypothetical protein
MNDQTGSSKAEQPNVLRRRLAKGALAAPVVLASLASKPVLADFNLGVPWLCTLSGQLSGNMSGHETESCDGGTSHAGFGSYLNRGVTIKNQFGMAEDLVFVFTATPTTMTLDGNTLGTRVATIGEVLDATSPGYPSAEHYAQKALVILLNAENLTDTSFYPLTEAQAINLFIAACKSQNFVDTNPNINWNYDQVKAYIDLLYF